MGYNTIALFANDAYEQFKENPEQTIKNLTDGMNNGKNSLKGYYPVGNHANPMKVCRPKHSSDSSIYVHQGNTLCEMGAFCTETENLMKQHPEFFESMLETMEYAVEKLRSKLENSRSDIPKKVKVSITKDYSQMRSVVESSHAFTKDGSVYRHRTKGLMDLTEAYKELIK